MTRRQTLTCFTLIVSLVLITGCWDRKETDELALVMASGVDLAEDGKIELSLQIALPTAIPSPSPIGGRGGPVVVVSAKGKDGTEAFEKIQQQLSRRIFLGHRGVAVIGEKYARHGFDRVLDPLMRQPESRYNCFLLTTYGTTAKEILMSRFKLELEQIPAIGMYKMQLGKHSIAVKIDEFVRTVPADGLDPVSGAIRFVNKGKENEDFVIDKAAVYRSYKLAGFLSGQELTYFRLIKGDARMISISSQVTPPQSIASGTVAARVLRARPTIKTRIKKGSPEVSVEIKAVVRINENNTNLDLTKAANLKLVETKMAKDMQKAVAALIKRTQKKFNADILGIGSEIHIQHPYAWRQMKGRWKEIYPTVPITVRTQITVDRMGRMQAPAHLQKAETK